MLITTEAGDILISFVFIRENKAWHFKESDDSLKNNNKKIQNVAWYNVAYRFKG